MSDCTTISRIFDKNNMIVGRIRIEDDFDAVDMHGSVDNFLMLSCADISVRTYWNNQISEDFYNSGGDSQISEAWDRFCDEYVESEAVEIFKRYMKIFHPMVPLHVESVNTGYSQGDFVGLVLWAEHSDKNDWKRNDGPMFVWSANMLELLKDTASNIGSFVRGQFVSAHLEEPMVVDMDLSEDEESMTADLVWTEVDSSYGIFYTKEFDPSAEVIEILGSDWTPKGCRLEVV